MRSAFHRRRIVHLVRGPYKGARYYRHDGNFSLRGSPASFPAIIAFRRKRMIPPTESRFASVNSADAKRRGNWKRIKAILNARSISTAPAPSGAHSDLAKSRTVRKFFNREFFAGLPSQHRSLPVAAAKLGGGQFNSEFLVENGSVGDEPEAGGC